MVLCPRIRLEDWLQRCCVYDMHTVNPKYGEIHRLLNAYPCLDAVRFTVNFAHSEFEVAPYHPCTYDLIEFDHGSPVDLSVLVNNDDLSFASFRQCISGLCSSNILVPLVSLHPSRVLCHNHLSRNMTFQAYVFQIPLRIQLRFAAEVVTRNMAIVHGRLRRIIEPELELLDDCTDFSTFI